MTELTFQRERVADCLDEIKPLLAMHYDEIAHDKDIPLDPDWDAYLKMDAIGMLRVFTARTADHLVGYVVFFVNYNLHYRGSKRAAQDVLFLHPGVRRGLTAYRFITWCDTQLRAEGVQIVAQHLKVAHDFGRLLERIGYELVDRVYCRRLDRG